MSAKDDPGGRPTFRGRTAAIGVVLIGLGSAAAFYFQDHLLPSHAVTSAEARAIGGDTPFHEHVAQAGITTCAAAFPAMGQLLTQNSQYMVQTRWNEQAPNRHAVQSVVGMHFDTPEYEGPAVGVVLAAPLDTSCEAGAIRITPFEASCEDVARRFLGGSAMTARLQGLPIYDVAEGSQVITLPAGGNCVAISVGYSAAAFDVAN